MPFSAWPRCFTPKNRVREPFYHENENAGFLELRQRQRVDAASAEGGSCGSCGRALDDDERGMRSGGTEFDRARLRDLPAGIDPCGEYGEFHSFAYDGPMFDRPISALAGEIVDRDGFVFADVC